MLGNGELRKSIFEPGAEDRIVVVPQPDKKTMEDEGGASLDLRLGRWFRTMRRSNISHVDMGKLLTAKSNEKTELNMTKEVFVQFDEEFVLHPGQFVLAATLEWVKIPVTLVGHITGKSSLGRRGLIIETAAGIQPGFTGCITLELANVGEVPISLVPAMQICQIFFSKLAPGSGAAKSKFTGRRKPGLGIIKVDPLVSALRKTS